MSERPSFHIPFCQEISAGYNTAFLLVDIPIWRDFYALILRGKDTFKLGSSLGVSSIFVKVFVYVSMGYGQSFSFWLPLFTNQGACKINELCSQVRRK